MQSFAPYFMRHDSPLGTMILACTDHGLCGVWFEDQRHFGGTDGWIARPDHQLLRETAGQLDEYFSGRRKDFSVALDLRQRGTTFQQQVWKQLLQIEFGATSSYGRQATLLNRPAAVRAVGGAIGRNPISIIVPCHRVLAGNGALTGYAGGLARKRFLLELEGNVH